MPASEMVATAFLAACLPVAVWWEEDLEVESLVDADFLFRVPRIARGHARMHSRKRATVVHAQGATSEPRPDRVVGTSFTGGVDSFYTLLGNREGVTPLRALVTGLGLDTRSDDLEGHAILIKQLGRVATEFGLTHYRVRTNFRDLFNPYADPSRVSQGACLVAFAFLLSGSLHTYLIPSGAPIDRMTPFSNHALLDGAWISRPTRTVSDGWDRHRHGKLAQIAANPTVQRELRVCQEGRGLVNCGRCEKCVGTMAAFALNGIREIPAFPHRTEASHILDLQVRKRKNLPPWRMLRDAARKDPETAWLAATIDRMLLVTWLRTPRYRLHLWKRRNAWPLRRL